MIVEILLTLLMVIYAPIPFLVIFAHLLTMKNKNPKPLLFIITPLLWILIGFLAYLYFPVLFINKIDHLFIKIIGIFFFLIVIFIDISTRKTLGNKRIMGSSEIKGTKEKLVTIGIYRYARHPRHVEHPLLVLSLGMIFSFIFLIWFSLYLFLTFGIASYFEEKELIKRYGKQYLDYKKNTPAFFIPFKKS